MADHAHGAAYPDHTKKEKGRLHEAFPFSTPGAAAGDETAAFGAGYLVSNR